MRDREPRVLPIRPTAWDPADDHPDPAHYRMPDAGVVAAWALLLVIVAAAIAVAVFT